MNQSNPNKFNHTSVFFKTESGSLYHIFEEGCKIYWARLSEPNYEGAHKLRTRDGMLNSRPDVEVGREVRMFSTPLDPTKDVRLIQTSRVVEIMTVAQ